jgi:hypothetical protein
MPDALRLEINRRSITAVHMKRHRDMLVRDHPFAIDLAEANGHAHPNVGFRAVCPFSGDSVEAVTKGNLIARGNIHFTSIEAERTLKRG